MIKNLKYCKKSIQIRNNKTPMQYNGYVEAYSSHKVGRPKGFSTPMFQAISSSKPRNLPENAYN